MNQRFQKMHLNPAWKGGRIVDSKGYAMILRHDHPRAHSTGYVYEHILVMETILGRQLSMQEKVHHLDENRQNNSPDNLELFASIGEHHAFHRGNEWLEKSWKRIFDQHCGRKL